MIKLKELVKHHCECGNSCCGVNESQQDKIRAQKKFQIRFSRHGQNNVIFRMKQSSKSFDNRRSKRREVFEFG